MKYNPKDDLKDEVCTAQNIVNFRFYRYSNKINWKSAYIELIKKENKKKRLSNYGAVLNRLKNNEAIMRAFLNIKREEDHAEHNLT